MAATAVPCRRSPGFRRRLTLAAAAALVGGAAVRLQQAWEQSIGMPILAYAHDEVRRLWQSLLWLLI